MTHQTRNDRSVGVTRARSMATAQTVPIRGDVDANVEQHLRLAEIAAREQARILVFPELSMAGYEIDLAHDLAFSQEDPRLTALVDAAHSCSMDLLVGAPVRVGAQLHVGAFIIYPDRSVELYTKHHLGAFSAGAGCKGNVPPTEATVFLRRRPESLGSVRRQRCGGSGVRRHGAAVPSPRRRE